MTNASYVAAMQAEAASWQRELAERERRAIAYTTPEERAIIEAAMEDLDQWIADHPAAIALLNEMRDPAHETSYDMGDPHHRHKAPRDFRYLSPYGLGDHRRLEEAQREYADRKAEREATKARREAAKAAKAAAPTLPGTTPTKPSAKVPTVAPDSVALSDGTAVSLDHVMGWHKATTPKPVQKERPSYLTLVE